MFTQATLRCSQRTNCLERGGQHDVPALSRPAPRPDRQVAAWHWLEGLTERAIAQRLGVSQRAVHKRPERIRAHLRQQLEK
jgi:DNA-directed RNA polymerase specialized sigma24 family protein